MARSGSGVELTDSLKRLEIILAESSKLGLAGIKLEASVALGEAKLRAGETSAGRTLLAGLQKEARASGHHRIARKAEQALMRSMDAQ